MFCKQISYWHRNLLVIGVLLVVWLAVTFVPVYFAIPFSHIFIFGWPFSFWMAAIGAPAMFLIIIGFYAWYMDRVDRERRSKQQGQ